MDIFLKEDVNRLLNNKDVVIMGDSNMRSLYKDLLCLKRTTSYIGRKALKKKMELTAFGDRLLTNFPKINSRQCIEEREANIDGTKISYYFITRVYDSNVERILKSINSKHRSPDIFVINSCLWDLTRWGPRGVESFKLNIVALMAALKQYFPSCLVIWLTTPPVAQEMKGGFLVKQLEFMKYSLRFHIVEANRYALKVVRRYGFDVLDIHYHLKMQLKRRAPDGIHWLPAAMRYITNLLLTHISLAWSVPLPHRYSPISENYLIPDCLNKDDTSKQPQKTMDGDIEMSAISTDGSINTSGNENSDEESNDSASDIQNRKIRSIIVIPQNTKLWEESRRYH